MSSKEKQTIKDNSDVDYGDEFSSIEAPGSIDEGIQALSLVEEVFSQLSISEGFNPGFFTNQDLTNLSVASIPLRSAVASELYQRAAQKLSTHIVKGEENEAQSMIEKNPKLLLIRTAAINYSERIVIGTPFQAALGAGDIPMWEMMLPYFESLEQGEALRQFDEQFPEGIEDDTPAHALKAYYNDIALAIIQHEDKGLSTLERFRKEITAQKKITQGKHFNLQHLIAAYRAYSDNIEALGSLPNREFFWQKVVGYVQRQITAYDAQVLCSGVWKVLNCKNSFSRTFTFETRGEWFPLSQELGLGFDFTFTNFWDRIISLTRGKGWHSLSIPTNLENYVDEKQRALAGLRESLKQGTYHQFN